MAEELIQNAKPLSELLTEADDKFALTKTFHPLEEWRVRLAYRKFKVLYVTNSEKMAGSQLSAWQTEQSLIGEPVENVSANQQVEAAGHGGALDWTRHLALDNEPLDVSHIRQIHNMILDYGSLPSGGLRERAVRLRFISHTPPYPEFSEPMMEKMLEGYYADKRHPILRIAWLHNMLHAIHPFRDGNGRTARLTVNLELLKLGYPAVVFYAEDKQAYCDAVEAFGNDGDVEPTARMIVGYLIRALDTTLRLLSKDPPKRYGMPPPPPKPSASLAQKVIRFEGGHITDTYDRFCVKYKEYAEELEKSPNPRPFSMETFLAQYKNDADELIYRAKDSDEADEERKHDAEHPNESASNRKESK